MKYNTEDDVEDDVNIEDDDDADDDGAHSKSGRGLAETAIQSWALVSNSSKEPRMINHSHWIEWINLIDDLDDLNDFDQIKT